MQLPIYNLEEIVVLGLQCLLYGSGGREVSNNLSIVIVDVLNYSKLCFCFMLLVAKAG